MGAPQNAHNSLSLIFVVVTCKHRVCLSSLLHLSCLLVRTVILFANLSFTNMGQPICQWLHWKYHFTWDDPWIFSLGVGLVFAFVFFAWTLVFLLALFVSLYACLFAYFLCFHFCFCSYFSLLFVSSLVPFRRIVSHETMYDSWNKLGKVQEALCYYYYLVIYHPAFVWRTCYF